LEVLANALSPRNPLELEAGLAGLDDLDEVVHPHFVFAFLPLEQLLGIDVDTEDKLDFLPQLLDSGFVPNWEEDFAEDGYDFVFVDGFYLPGLVGEEGGEGLIEDVPEAVDGQFAVVIIVFEAVEALAFPQPVQAEDDPNAPEEVTAGNARDEDQKQEDYDGTARVCPTEHVANLLHRVYHRVYHPKHQLNNLLHLEYLLQQTRQLLLYLECFVMYLELPRLKFLIFSILSLLQLALESQPVILLQFH
jgi:hypothetical protein